jgi:serine protease Do
MDMKRWCLFLILALVVGASPAQSQNVTPLSFEGFNIEDAVINVANTAGKAVVSISTERLPKMGGKSGGEGSRRFYFEGPFGEDSPFGENDPFRRFFDDFFGQLPQRDYKQVGLGSGVIIDPQGYILTNEHVVDKADKITVTLPDGREFKGEVKGEDSRSDLAVIKINASNLPIAKLGDSDSLKIGQWAVAIGNPYAFAMQNPEPTVTIGVISALHRALGRAFPRDKDYNDLIQTDAAINPGNSGGPLVNLKGEIVGINVAIFSTSGGYQGIGFAIPINNAKRIIARLIEGKKILYGWLGVTVQDLNDDLAKYFGLAEKKGVLAVKVMENSPAQKAGMKEGDIIKLFDNNPVNSVRELLNVVGRAEVGRKVKAVVSRDKKEIALDIMVGERPENLESLEEGRAGSEEGFWRGIKAEALDSEAAKRFKIEEKKGVLVTDVEPMSAADDAGIIPGDIITEINKQPVKGLADYQRITKEVKGNCLVVTSRGYFLVKESESKE